MKGFSQIVINWSPSSGIRNSAKMGVSNCSSFQKSPILQYMQLHGKGWRANMSLLVLVDPFHGVS
jgi:hypothetical protein